MFENPDKILKRKKDGASEVLEDEAKELIDAHFSALYDQDEDASGNLYDQATGNKYNNSGDEKIKLDILPKLPKELSAEELVEEYYKNNPQNGKNK